MSDSSNKTEQEFLLEQYKLYVEMADRAQARRADANKFYIGILSGLIAVLSLTFKTSMAPGLQWLLYFTAGCIGVAINAIWYRTILSFRQLSSGKFDVIMDMEKQLPYCCYEKEWERLGRGRDRARYQTLTSVERWVPVAMGASYALLAGFSLWSLIVPGLLRAVTGPASRLIIWLVYLWV